MKQSFFLPPGPRRSVELKIAAVLILIVVVILVTFYRGRIFDKSHRVEPAAAQPNPLIDGQQVSWSEQQMSWTLPPGWSKKTVSKDEFVYTASDDASLKVSAEALAPGLPAEISLQGYYQGAQVRQKNGQLDEVKWLELDGVRGVQVRDSGTNPNHARSLQWTTVRKFGGSTERVGLTLSVNGASFEIHRDEFYAILNSTKIAH